MVLLHPVVDDLKVGTDLFSIPILDGSIRGLGILIAGNIQFPGRKTAGIFVFFLVSAAEKARRFVLMEGINDSPLSKIRRVQDLKGIGVGVE